MVMVDVRVVMVEHEGGHGGREGGDGGRWG